MKRIASLFLYLIPFTIIGLIYFILFIHFADGFGFTIFPTGESNPYLYNYISEECGKDKLCYAGNLPGEEPEIHIIIDRQ